MMVYAEIIDKLADLLYNKSKELELNQYNLGYLQAIKDIRYSIIEDFEREINSLEEKNPIDNEKKLR